MREKAWEMIDWSSPLTETQRKNLYDKQLKNRAKLWKLKLKEKEYLEDEYGKVREEDDQFSMNESDEDDWENESEDIT